MKLRARCPICLRRLTLRKGGRIPGHAAYTNGGITVAPCKGSGKSVAQALVAQGAELGGKP